MKETIYRIMTALGVLAYAVGAFFGDRWFISIMLTKYPDSWYWGWGSSLLKDPTYLSAMAFLAVILAIIMASVGYDAFKILKEMRKER